MPTASPDPILLARALETLVARTPVAERLAGDPLAFPRRYTDPADQEIAALLASSLAFGRVAAFWPVLEAIFATADAHGGPAAFVRSSDRAPLLRLQYRWVRGGNLAQWADTLGEALRRHGRLADLARACWDPDDADLGMTLDRLVGELRACAVAVSVRRGGPDHFAALPRPFRTFLPRPAEHSACKRWCMALRWLVRPPGDPDRVDGIDLGLWDLPPAGLVIPLDTHVARISLLLGLTSRSDGSFRTAREVTAALAALDPADPLRFDFALAHMGISGVCTVRKDGDRPPPAAVCRECPLAPLCVVGRAHARSGATG